MNNPYKKLNQNPKLYPDFTLTVDNCDIEPINRPRAIQGHGHIIVFSKHNPEYVFALDDGLASLLKNEHEQMMQQPIRKWLPPAILELYQEMEERRDPIDPIPVMIGNQLFNLIRHESEQFRYMEIEHPAEPGAELSTFRAIRLVTEPFGRCNTVETLSDQLAKGLKQVTGYDRVMVYQFDVDYHGKVIAEAKEEHLESFMGMHYPASDIPKMARNLFLENRSRIIADVDLDNRWLIFNPGLNNKIPLLDLTHTQLRATSPVHIEYLKNMGVRATFTLAIIIDDKLWGLIASHHYSPRFISYELRKTGELIANTFSQSINEIIKNQSRKEQIELRTRKEQVLGNLLINKDIAIKLFDDEKDLSSLFHAHGFAFCSNFLGSYSKGVAPDRNELSVIHNYLEAHEADKLYQSNDFMTESELLLEQPVGGILAIRVDSGDPFWLIWFKRPMTQIFQWSGDPDQPYEVDHLEGGEVRISPRKSFEKWKVQIDNKSEPWSEHELEEALRLRENMLVREIERQLSMAKSMKEEYEQLTWIASHDLREPVRTVTSYIHEIKKGIGKVVNKAELDFYLARTEMATRRMNTLIEGLLQYSLLNQSDQVDWVHTNQVIVEIVEDFKPKIDSTGAIIQVEKLPQIRCSPSMVKQLFQNLISNALKYRDTARKIEIHIKYSELEHNGLFEVQDNGIGIEAAYYDKIFMMFKRLHGKEEYEGTGIGLAACKKIIETMEGKIWVESEPDVGSSFKFKLHHSLLKAEGKDGIIGSGIGHR